MITRKVTVVLSAVVASALISGGCATKKHVREAIAPVQTQVSDVDKRVKENKASIGDLDRSVATADEKATDAGKRAGQAADAASAAQNSANQAGQRADAANSAAQQAQQGVSRLDKSLQNLDNYHLVDTKQVYFRTGQSLLDKDAKAELDTAAGTIGTGRNYVIEIEGFADTTGNKAMNVELSRKRAGSVVRYLTVDHSVPLRDIRELGIGSEFPNALNKTRADRKNNRRVDVKIYALDITGAQGQATSQNGSASTPGSADHGRPVQ